MHMHRQNYTTTPAQQIKVHLSNRRLLFAHVFFIIMFSSCFVNTSYFLKFVDSSSTFKK